MPSKWLGFGPNLFVIKVGTRGQNLPAVSELPSENKVVDPLHPKVVYLPNGMKLCF